MADRFVRNISHTRPSRSPLKPIRPTVFVSKTFANAESLNIWKWAGRRPGMPRHLEIHFGDIGEKNSVYGGAVNIASRISGLSAPSEVLVSDTKRSLARTSAGGCGLSPGASA